MCGIAGVAGAGVKLNDSIVLASLAHRGPDASGVDQAVLGDWSCTIAHTRLAINDLSTAGNQPLTNEDDSIALVFNGEIYNYRKLRQLCEARGHHFKSDSDAEVVLHLWEDEGAASLRRLNGIFALALLNKRTGQLALARDPLGVKPLFWCVQGRSLWFASELAAIVAAGAPTSGHDPVALAQFLTFLWIPDPRTPYRNIHSLVPGHLLYWRAGEHRLESFGDLLAESAAADPISTTTARDEIGERVREAVQRQLLADVPVGLLASGGIDSSLIWWAAADGLVRAYTIDWPQEQSDEGLHEDTEAVRTLERHFSTEVTYVSGDGLDIAALPPSGDLFADPAVDLCRLISGRARTDGVKVLLSGQGGDELFGGYRRHLLGPLAARVPGGSVGRGLARVVAERGPQNTRSEYLHRLLLATAQRGALASYLVLCSYSTARDRADALGCAEAEVTDEIVWQRHQQIFDRLPQQWSLLQRFRAVDLAVYMPGLGLAYSDRAGMQQSVEIRVPWLDLDLVRWALRLRDDALVRGRNGKWITRDLAREVLPRDTVDRPKRGFGAPKRVLPQFHPGQRGFRQGLYFSSAKSLLDRWVGSSGEAVG